MKHLNMDLTMNRHLVNDRVKSKIIKNTELRGNSQRKVSNHMAKSKAQSPHQTNG